MTTKTRAKFISEEPRFYPLPNGTLVPSVTTITKVLSGLEFQGPLDKYKIEEGKGSYNRYAKALKKTQIRGTRVHNVCEDIFMGKTTKKGAEVGITRYVDSFRKWQKENPDYNSDFIPKSVEIKFADPYYKYGGTADILYGAYCIDLKTCKKTPRKPYLQHIAQVVAYSIGLSRSKDVDPTNIIPYLLYLDSKGNYRFFCINKKETRYHFKLFMEAKRLWKTRNEERP